MINREITYERDINKSYMKIPSIMEECFDEKLIFHRTYPGCIPVEKCYMNGHGQYWYNITGKQALDAYCRVNTIGQSFFETLILRICNQLEQLEWNLIDSNCLMMDPELIFVNSRGEDVSFVLYPSNSGNFLEELRQLIEYLLTKLNHGDTEAVQAAYKIYEITLSEEYSMSELRECILKGKVKAENETTRTKSVVESLELHERELSFMHKDKTKTAHAKKVKGEEFPIQLQKQIEEKLSELCKKAKQILNTKAQDWVGAKNVSLKKKEEIPVVVYPDEPIKEETAEVHPTICLTAAVGQPQGRLIYEGFEGYPDFILEEMVCMIGKNARARMQINKETISQFHAKIDYVDGTYYIEDMNSTNGTFVDEEILNYKERKMLHGGELLRFADVKYRFI